MAKDSFKTPLCCRALTPTALPNNKRKSSSERSRGKRRKTRNHLRLKTRAVKPRGTILVRRRTIRPSSTRGRRQLSTSWFKWMRTRKTYSGNVREATLCPTWFVKRKKPPTPTTLMTPKTSRLKKRAWTTTSITSSICRGTSATRFKSTFN